MQITDEQIRRFAELGGIHIDCGACLPNFRADLEACFAVLEHVCKQRGLWFQLHQTFNRNFIINLQDESGQIVDGAATVTETKQDAIILAVLACGGKR